ncbi:MAG: disulfide bond formation protein DsbB [halophilic archaeon J07HX5]|jgi:Disulfide bond formation protein DsbB.|nr:MAG: disulfide bond formation protein DsbB [halophilic archaeon J07HX5]
MGHTDQTRLLQAATVVAVVGVVGSVLFESLEYTPCRLCYRQRWLLTAVGVVSVGCLRYRSGALYGLGVVTALTGATVAAYHTGLQLTAASQPGCVAGGCETVSYRVAGFVTIPMLSATAFGLTAVLLAAAVYDRVGGLR